MKTILIPTDFSVISTHAARYTAAFCNEIGITTIILYHSYKIPHPEMVMIADVLVPKHPDADNLKNESIQKLIELRDQIKSSLSEEIVVEYLADERSFIEAINEISIQEHVNLIGMGISGTGKREENIVGSHTFEALKDSNRSLLIVPKHADYQKVTSSVLALDIRNVEENLPIGQLNHMIKAFSSKLFVVNVTQEIAIKSDDLPPKATQFNELIGDLQPEYHDIKHDSPVEAILEFTEIHHVDLIIAVARKRGLLENLFHESVTQNLAINTVTPLLILKNY